MLLDLVHRDWIQTFRMVVRIRVPRGATAGRSAGKHAPLVSGVGGLVGLAAVSCLMLALWRLTSDLGWTEPFVIADGMLSHWQVWMAMTIASGALAFRLVRYGRQREDTGNSDGGRAE